MSVNLFQMKHSLVLMTFPHTSKPLSCSGRPHTDLIVKKKRHLTGCSNLSKHVYGALTFRDQIHCRSWIFTELYIELDNIKLLSRYKWISLPLKPSFNIFMNPWAKIIQTKREDLFTHMFFQYRQSFASKSVHFSCFCSANKQPHIQLTYTVCVRKWFCYKSISLSV